MDTDAVNSGTSATSPSDGEEANELGEEGTQSGCKDYITISQQDISAATQLFNIHRILQDPSKIGNLVSFHSLKNGYYFIP